MHRRAAGACGHCSAARPRSRRSRSTARPLSRDRSSRSTSPTSRPSRHPEAPAGHASAARASLSSPCRCSRTTSWSAPSSSTARRCGRSPTSRSSWCRTSPRRPSSPSRTRGCSTSCASAPTISPNRWSSRPRPPRCSRSSPARPANLQPVFDAMLANATRICEAKFGILFAAATATHFSSVAAARRAAGACRMRSAARTASGRPPDSTLDRAHADQAGRSHRRLTIGRAGIPGSRRDRARRRAHAARRADAQGRRADRRHRHLSPGGPAVHRQADRAGAELRRPGGHRHREHAAAQRAAPAHRRSHRVAGAADRDLGGAEGHLQLARRAGAGVRGHAGERDAHLRGASSASLFLLRRRRISHGRRCTTCRRRCAERWRARAADPARSECRLGRVLRPSRSSTSPTSRATTAYADAIRLPSPRSSSAARGRCSSCRCSRTTS